MRNRPAGTSAVMQTIPFNRGYLWPVILLLVGCPFFQPRAITRAPSYLGDFVPTGSLPETVIWKAVAADARESGVYRCGLFSMRRPSSCGIGSHRVTFCDCIVWLEYSGGEDEFWYMVWIRRYEERARERRIRNGLRSR